MDGGRNREFYASFYDPRCGYAKVVSRYVEYGRAIGGQASSATLVYKLPGFIGPLVQRL